MKIHVVIIFVVLLFITTCTSQEHHCYICDQLVRYKQDDSIYVVYKDAFFVPDATQSEINLIISANSIKYIDGTGKTIECVITKCK